MSNHSTSPARTRVWSSRRAVSALGLMSLVGGLLFTASPPAGAAFPGANGLIAFERLTIITDEEIYTVAPNGTNLTKLTNNTDRDLDPAWSANGQKIAFASNREGDFDIWTMAVDGTDLTKITDNAGDSGDELNPTFSPDGSMIAFERSADDVIATAPIAGVGGDGSGLSTPGLSADHSPSWSPSGDFIAFQRNVFLSDIEVFTVDVLTGAEDNITANGIDDETPDYAPNASRLIAERSGGISTFDALSGLVPTVVTVPGDDANPAFSPDGTEVVFDRLYPFSSQIETMNADGTGGSGVVVPGSLFVGNLDPSWQPTTAPVVLPPAPGFNRLSVVRGGNGTGTVTSSPAGINCGSDCLEDYLNGTAVTLTAAPTSDSQLASWNVAGCTGLTCVVNLNADTTVNPVFNLKSVSPAAIPKLDARCGQPLVICGTEGHDNLFGGPNGELFLAFGGDDNLVGGGGSDVMLAGNGNNIIRGGPGNDDMFGGTGRDHMRGGPGSDGLTAGAGNDRLIGGAAFDDCNSGPGNDFVKGCEA